MRHSRDFVYRCIVKKPVTDRQRDYINLLKSRLGNQLPDYLRELDIKNYDDASHAINALKHLCYVNGINAGNDFKRKKKQWK